MREVDGFVFIADMVDEPGDSFIFGPKNRGRVLLCENFTTNGLRAFATREEVEVAGSQCREIGRLTNFRTARIRMSIGETPDEWILLLRTGDSWVVISDIDFRQELRGKYREGCVPKAIPGGDLQMNGICPLDDPDSVLHIRSECQRQFGVHSRIATFSLTDVEPQP